MPEGHTLHRLAADLTTAFGGRPVRVASPQGRFADASARLDGHVLAVAEAWGKHLFLGFGGEPHPKEHGADEHGAEEHGVEEHGVEELGVEEQWVHVHLGLYGTFLIARGEAPAPVGQVRLRIVGAEAYADLRGATTCALVTEAERAAVIARLGPDPLRSDSDPSRAWDRISRSRSPIGGLLMDQGVLAGVGNVYRAELLFRHRIDPMRPGNTLSRRKWNAMWADLVALMHQGVEDNRIDTVRAEHTPEAMGRPPRRDDHGGEVYVYRRAGQPCHVCGRPVRTAELQGRNLFWCPGCQRAASPGSARTRTATGQSGIQ